MRKRFAAASGILGTCSDTSEIKPAVDSGRRLLIVATGSLLFLVAGTLLFPDTFSSAGLRVGGIRLSPISILFALAAPQIAVFILAQRHKLTFGLLDFFLLTSTAFVLIRGVFANDSQVNTLALVLGYSAYTLIIYYGTSLAAQDERVLRAFVYMLVTLGVIIAAYAMVEFLLNKNIIFGDLISKRVAGRDFNRSGSTLGHPIALGIFLVQLAPFLVFFFGRAGTFFKKFAWNAGIVLVAVALETTFTKGSWIAAIALGAMGIAWFAWREPKSRKPILVLLVTVGAAFMIFNLFFRGTVTNSVFSDTRINGSVNTRWYMWNRAPGAFLLQPWIGAGEFQGAAQVERVHSEEQQFVVDPTSIGNVYLTWLVEGGAIGCLLIGGTLVFVGRQVWQLLRSGGKAGMWAIPLAAALSVGLLQGLTSDTFLVFPAMVVFWMLAGLVRALSENGTRKIHLPELGRKDG